MNYPRQMVFTAALLAGTVFAPHRATAAGWLDAVTVTATGTASWVENLSRTSFEPTRKDAATYELSLSASRHQQLASAWLVHGGIEATLLAVPDYDLGNHLELGPRLGLQRKFGLGPLAPVLQLDTALSYKSTRLDADRGWTAEASLRLGKRFTPGFKAGLAGQWIEHNARRATFDLSQHSLSVDATWDLTEQWSLNGSVGRLSGDIVANAAWPVWAQAISGGFGATVFNYYTARPWEVTNLYGDGWVSYNVEADVDLWSLAAAYALSDRTTAELRYGSAFVVNKIGIRYPTDSWGLSVVHRF
ncbi:MAG TPA: porin [Lacunisphaera sp.]